MKSTESDPVIDEIREVRHRISERFGHDPVKLVAHYMELQQQYQDRLIDAGKRAENNEQSAAERAAVGQ
jgi:hypothetical protein